MQIRDLPMNEKIKFIDEEYTSVMLTRVEEEKVIAQYVDKFNGDEVAKMNLWANGDSELVNFDTAYWSYTINNRPATNDDVKDLIGKKVKSANISVKDRLIQIIL
jgi:phage host-nuclease inhibitor protein Gam